MPEPHPVIARMRAVYHPEFGRIDTISTRGDETYDEIIAYEFRVYTHHRLPIPDTHKIK